MAFLTTSSSDVPAFDRLVDEGGNPLITDAVTNIGSDLVIFTTMMSFLLMVFGGDNAPG